LCGHGSLLDCGLGLPGIITDSAAANPAAGVRFLVLCTVLEQRKFPKSYISDFHKLVENSPFDADFPATNTKLP
jgi:hypothetical protein